MVEGPHGVDEALRANAGVQEIFVAEDASATPAAIAVARRAESAGVEVYRTSSAVVSALADTVTPQGIVAVVEAAPASLHDAVAGAALVLVMAGVSDPGNAGTLIRTAAAAGADAVVLTRGSVDPWSPKVARASAGSLFHIRAVAGADLYDAMGELRRSGLAIVGAETTGPTPYDHANLSGRVALVVGSEARGIPPRARELFDDRICIPMPGHGESLNLAVAGSVLLFEAVRQRRSARSRAGQGP